MIFRKLCFLLIECVYCGYYVIIGCYECKVVFWVSIGGVEINLFSNFGYIGFNLS